MMSRWTMAVWVGVLATTAGVSRVTSAADGQEILSPTLLDYAGLRLGWQVNLPLQAGEGVDRMMIQDAYLYILTTNNHLFCIERPKGTLRFGFPLAQKGLPVQDPSYYDGKAWFMVGNRLKVIDPRLGVIAENSDLSRIGIGTIFGVMRNKENLYLSDPTGRLRVLKADEYWQKFSVTADDNSPIMAAIVDDAFVVFATSGGSVVRIEAQSPKKQWQYDLSGGVRAPMARDGEWLYVAGMDTKLYKLNLLTGVSGWPRQFQTSVANLLSPIVGAKVVYQPVGEKGLFAVDKETGAQRWHLPQGISLMTEKDDTAYVFARPSTLVAIKNSTGKIDYTLNFTPIVHSVVNRIDSVLYGADAAGRVACVEIVPNR
jgi:outer membrane protein assembly factor BamB